MPNDLNLHKNFEPVNELAKNAKININLEGWPAAVTILGGASILGGVTCYGINKYYEYKELTSGLDNVDYIQIDDFSR